MATVTTTTNATPLIWPSTTLIDSHRDLGDLYLMVKASTANTYQLWRSTNNGVSWSLLTSLVRANIVEIGSIVVAGDGLLYWCFRTNESGQDRVYTLRVAIGTTPQWGSQLLLSAVANGGVAGAIYQGLDIQVVVSFSQNTTYVAVAVGTTSGSKHGVTLFGETINQSKSIGVANLAIFSGARQWLHTGTGRITPSLDLEHTGTSKHSAVPHLWLTWGRTQAYATKLTWSGSRWNGTTSVTTLNPVTLTPAQDHLCGRWIGDRLTVAVPNPADTDTVLVLERNRANTVTTATTSPAHPTGIIRNCAVNYNTVNRDLRVLAVGTSSTVLHYADYVRATGVWTSWAQVTATAILGATGNNYSVRRSSHGNARHDVVTAHATPTPNTIVHTGQVLTYAPDVPEWDTAAMGRASGAAADVAATLLLDWQFSDPDPNDSQTAFALSRQIGAGALAYFRASDATWQATEQKNASGTTSRTLAAAWGLDADQPHTYRVKVWDEADVASLYSAGLVVIPTAKINPAITDPTPAEVITTDTVTLTWTVAQQTAYRIGLATDPGGVAVFDSRWVSSTATTVQVPFRLDDGTGWTVSVQTRNLEGLASDVASVAFTVNFIEPATPSLTAAALPAIGAIRVTIVNPAPAGGQPAVADQDLYRRIVGDLGDGVRVAAGLADSAVHDDWRAVSGVAYAYRVLTRGVNGASILSPWIA